MRSKTRTSEAGLEEVAAARLTPPAHAGDHGDHDHRDGRDREADDQAGQEHDNDEALDWTELARIAFVALAAAAVWLGIWEPSAQVSVIGLIGDDRRRVANLRGSMEEHP